MLTNKNIATQAAAATGCRLCGSRGAGPHRGRLLCGGCGMFIRWLGKAEVMPQDNGEKGAALAPEDWLAMPSD